MGVLKNRFLLHRELFFKVSVVLVIIFLSCFIAFHASTSITPLYIAFCTLSFFLIFNRPAIAVIMVLSVLTVYQLLGYIPHFEIGTFNIFLGDVLSIIFIGAAVLRLSMNARTQSVILSYPGRLFIIFSALAIIGILRGLPSYGQTTIVHAREHIYVIAATAYFCTFRFNKLRIKHILPIFFIFGILLLGIAYLGWLDILPKHEILLKREGTWLGERMLNRMGAFYLVFILFAHVISGINKVIEKPLLWWLTVTGLIIAIILNQVRTTWVVVFIGSLILAFKYRLKFIGKVLRVLFLLFILVSFLWFYQPKAISRVSNYLYNAATVFWEPEHTTLSWRIEGDKAYLKQMSLKDYALGVPFGTPIAYEIEGQRWVAGVHNMFIAHIYRVGILGLVAFTLLQIFLIIKINRILKGEKDKLIKNVLAVFWITLICYQVNFLAWTADFLYPVILGISMSMVAHYEYGKKVKLGKI